MEQIESTTKNCVTTECGHCFHTNCLMQNVAHNGFGCPYCRAAMAEKTEEEDESVWSDEEEEDDEEDEDEVFQDDENALRLFRFFFNNVNGEEHSPEDIEEETREIEEETREMEEEDNSLMEEEDVDRSLPTTDFVAQKLKNQGVTFEQLVKMMCYFEHEEYEIARDHDQVQRMSDEIFRKCRIIISNYTPEQA